jgi:hypothetical protein
MDIKLIKEVPAIIEMNFEEIKIHLESKLDEYKNIVVTEETLMDAKSDAKLLAGLRKKIDEFRKAKKKEMLEPISLFETKCNELVSMIADAETPIKIGISVFDEKRRQINIDFANAEIARICEELGVEDSYKEQFNWSSSYENLTATKKEISSDVLQRCENLLLTQQKEKIMKEQQKQEAERIEKERKEQQAIIAQQQYELMIAKREKDEAERLQKEQDRLVALEFEKIDKERKEELKKLQSLELERSKKEHAEAIRKEEIQKEKTEKVELITYNLKLTGSKRALQALKLFFEENNITYEKLEVQNG